MKVLVLAIGSEFVSARKEDTNSVWLSFQLERFGITPQVRMVVSDNQEILAQVFRQAEAIYDLVIATGGLGPTEDDRTRMALAQAMGVCLEENDLAMRWVRETFERRQRKMKANNLRQALVPRGGEPLQNELGTAPGVSFRAKSGTCFFLFPGPPRELHPLFERHVLPLLQDVTTVYTDHHLMLATGLGESNLDAKISDLFERFDQTEFILNFNPRDIEIHLKTCFPTKEEAVRYRREVVEALAERLGSYLFSLEGDSLAKVVVDTLREKGKTLACAESMTGGAIASELVVAEGASEIFLGGVSVYTVRAKMDLLGFAPEDLDVTVGPKITLEMAKRVRRRLGADYGLACTGYAGPKEVEGQSYPVGTYFLALVDEREEWCEKFYLPLERWLILKKAGHNALYSLYRKVRGDR